jgi:hypothetical protein
MKTSALLIFAVLGINFAGASLPCQDMADKVRKEFDAERKMNDADRPAKCRALSQVIADLTDIAVACGADTAFIDKIYKPLATAVGDEGPKACQR